VKLRTKTFVVCAGLVATALASTGCGGSSSAKGGDDPGEAVGTWYVVATNVFLPDGVAGHVIGTSTLEEQELTLADSVELPGGGTVHSAGDGRVFVGGWDTPILTRYDVGTDGTLRESGRLSFANLGITYTGFNPNQVQFIGPDRACVLTEERVVVWDPSELVIIDDIELPDVSREGYAVGVGYATFRRGSKLLFTLRWADSEGDRVLDETGLVSFDTATGTVDVTSVRGCGAAWGAEGGDGSIYWSSGAYDAAVHVLSDGTRSPAPCMVRLAPDADTLDEEVLALSGWVADRPIGSLWGVRPGLATVRVFEDASFDVTEETTSGELTFRALWSWYYVDLATGELTRIEGLGENGGSVFTYHVGDRKLVPAIPITEDSTVLWDITEGRAPERTLYTPGNVYSAVRAR